jgi:hypothetical protein
MQRRSGKWLADWTDENGVRKRKAFASEGDAKVYSRRMAEEAAEKARALGVSPNSRRRGQRRAHAEPLPSATKSKREQTIRQKFDILEAERMTLMLELGNTVLQAAIDLLPETIRQAKGSQKPTRSPVLRTLITRPAMRPSQIGKPRKSNLPTPRGTGPLRQKLSSEPAE